MQKIISQIPELSLLLSHLPRSQHFQAVKHLIRLGMQSTQNFTSNQNVQDQSHLMRRQLDIIKENIEELNNMVRQQPQNPCKCCQKGNQYTTQQAQKYNKNNTKKFVGDFVSFDNKVSFDKQNEQRPVRDVNQVRTINGTDNLSISPFSKNKSSVSRRNLDDTGARQALRFPLQILAEKRKKSKKQSQSFRKHVYQEEINKQDLGKIREEKGQSLDHLRRDRTVSDYMKATSKIKSLIQKDRIRYTQTQRQQQFRQGFDKYQYSDENQMEQSSLHQETARAYEAALEQHHSHSNIHYKDLQPALKASNRSNNNASNRSNNNPNNTSNNNHSNKSNNNHNNSSNNKASNTFNNNASDKGSSQKSQSKPSSKKQFALSKKEFDNELEGSLRGSKHQSQNGGSKQHYHNERQKQMYINGEQDQENQDDVISNSSSFSQFSMQGSRRKQVGKISRRSQND